MMPTEKDIGLSAQYVSRRSILGGTAAITIGLVAGAVFVPQSGRAQDVVPKRGGVLRVGVNEGSASDPKDPALAATSPTHLFTHQWGDTLIDLDAELRPVAMLAESFSSSSDAKQWVFKIRNGVKFHNDQDLTPQDVVATIERHSDKKSQSAALSLLSDIDKITIRERDVIFDLKQGNADFPILLADYHLVIQPNGGKDDPNACIGTGPYIVEIAEPGSRYVLRKNEIDWNSNRGYYDSVEIMVINDSTARNAALLSGQIHMSNFVDPKVAKSISEAPGITLSRTPSRQHLYFIATIDQAPFDNPDLVLALKYALNREEILEKVLFGYGSIGNDIPINSAYPLFDETLEQRPYDLEKAKEHYKKSAHDGSPIELIVSDVVPGVIEMGMLWQSSCAKAGIPLTVKRAPADGYWSEVWLKQKFYFDYTSGRPVQDQMYTTFYAADAIWNGTHFTNAKFNALLSEARAEINEEKRRKLYAEMGRIYWAEGSAFIPVFTDILCAYSNEIAGWQDHSNWTLMNAMAPSRTWFT